MNGSLTSSSTPPMFADPKIQHYKSLLSVILSPTKVFAHGKQLQPGRANICRLGLEPTAERCSTPVGSVLHAGIRLGCKNSSV